MALFAAETRAAIHICHVSSKEGLQMAEVWRTRGVDLTGEVTPHHCFLSTDDMARVGSIARVNPPLRAPGHGQALLDGLRRGALDYIASDHAPHLPAEKSRANVWHALSGFAGVETMLRLFLTYGGLSLPRLVQVAAEAPARAWGLYPGKGAIQVGSDADLILVDLDEEDVVEAARLHGKNNLSPWEGWRTRGNVVATIVRGRVVMRQGALLGQPSGRMLTPGGPVQTRAALRA